MGWGRSTGSLQKLFCFRIQTGLKKSSHIWLVVAELTECKWKMTLQAEPAIWIHFYHTSEENKPLFFFFFQQLCDISETLHSCLFLLYIKHLLLFLSGHFFQISVLHSFWTTQFVHILKSKAQDLAHNPVYQVHVFKAAVFSSIPIRCSSFKWSVPLLAPLQSHFYLVFTQIIRLV